MTVGFSRDIRASSSLPQVKEIEIQHEVHSTMQDYAKFPVDDGHFVQGLPNINDQVVPATLVASAITLSECCRQSSTARTSCLGEINGMAGAK